METAGFGPTAATPTDPGPLPTPEALVDVISRLADPAVAGVDKLALVQDTSDADAPVLDSFAAALRDNGFTPVTVRASDLVVQRPGDVLATIKMTGPDADSDAFSFPMEFHRAGPGWQLTRQTADMLLAFGNAHTAAPLPPPSPAPPR